MMHFGKVSMASVMVAITLVLSYPAQAADAATNLGNAICKSGGGEGGIGGVVNSLGASGLTVALGLREAARQASSPEYKCAVSAADISSFFATWFAANGSVEAYKTAFNAPTPPVPPATNGGIAGLATTSKNSAENDGTNGGLKVTFSDAPGSSPSPQ
jgi:hypothetical protein